MYSSAPKYVDVKTNGIGEVMSLGRKSPKNLEIENSSSEKIAESGLDDDLSLGEIFPLYLRMINLILIIAPSVML